MRKTVLDWCEFIERHTDPDQIAAVIGLSTSEETNDVGKDVFRVARILQIVHERCEKVVAMWSPDDYGTYHSFQRHGTDLFILSLCGVQIQFAKMFPNHREHISAIMDPIVYYPASDEEGQKRQSFLAMSLLKSFFVDGGLMNDEQFRIAWTGVAVNFGAELYAELLARPEIQALPHMHQLVHGDMEIDIDSLTKNL